MQIEQVIRNNIEEVKNFFTSKLSDYSFPNNNQYKINVDCPLCDNERHRKKAVLNLEWNNYYCYRCGKSGSLYNFCKAYNIQNEFLDLLSELSNTSLLTLKESLTNNKPTITEDNVDKHTNPVDKAEEYIKEHKFLKINEIKEAYNYALERSFGNKELIKNWYCCNKYIYIPTVFNGKINSLIGRLYLDLDNVPRYNNKMIDRDAVLCYNYDNVVSNYSLNTIYFTEGIFDSIAINYTLGGDYSIALLGKSHYKSLFDKLSKIFSRDTNICIVLDPVTKDKEIVKDNLNISNFIKDYFTNVYIINLEEYDCFDTCKKLGSNELKRQLEENKYSLFKYQMLFGGGIKK